MRSIVAITFLTILFAYGCSDNYYADGGLLDDNVDVLNVSTMDYLKSRSADFDTLVSLIQICGIEDQVNAKGNTFLAPRDYSIHNYFKLEFADLDEWPALQDFSQDELDKISGILKNYIIPNQEVVRENLSTKYSYVTTYGNQKARFNLVQTDYLGNVNKGAKYIIFSLNVSGEGEVEQYHSVTVVTSNLKSTNGILHILYSDSHIFGFN